MLSRRFALGLTLAAVVACGGGGSKTGGGGAGGSTTNASGGGGAGGSTASAGSGGSGGTTSVGGGGATGASGAGGALGSPKPFDLTKVDCYKKGDGKTTIALVNHCRAPMTFAGSNNQTGPLAPDTFACRDIGDATTNIPAIRYWGFTDPDPGLGRHTLAEFTFNTSFNDFDWYNISHVDASNLPMQIVAANMPSCRTLTCATSLLPGCPAVGQYKDAAGDVTACVSPMPNDPKSPVAQYFDMACADAYSWSGDDSNSVVACAGEDYIVVFCP
ncbi:MAG TPA: thaumatin family protein [Polyangia bacterium]|nr:thaumatin family protein [Polyangia bacterium]